MTPKSLSYGFQGLHAYENYIFTHQNSTSEMLDRNSGENSIRKKWNKIAVPLFGAAYAAPNKGTTFLYQFRSPLTVLNPTENSKFKDF